MATGDAGDGGEADCRGPWVRSRLSASWRSVE